MLDTRFPTSSGELVNRKSVQVPAKSFAFVPKEGLEPSRACAHCVLNTARLPITPLRLHLYVPSVRYQTPGKPSVFPILPPRKTPVSRPLPKFDSCQVKNTHVFCAPGKNRTYISGLE